MSAVINEAVIVFVDVNVPVSAESRLDLSNWNDVIQKIIEASTTRKIIVEKSMPFNLHNRTENIILHQNSQRLRFSAFSNSDFISQETTVQDLRDLKRVVIVRNHGRGEDLFRVHQLYSRYVLVERIFVVDDHKLVEPENIWISIYLTMIHTFGNVIPSICDTLNVDSNEMQRIIGYPDSENDMHTSIGFGETTIQDISYLKFVLHYSRFKLEAY